MSHFPFLLRACAAGLLVLAATPVAADSYAERLRAFQAEQAASPSKFTAEDRATMARAGADLARALPDPGIKVGEIAPDFALPDAHGNTVRLADLLKNGPVVLVFYRGAWCPYCNLQLKAFRDALPQFKAAGAQLVAVTPQKPDRSLEQFKTEPPGFPVLSDLTSDTMKAYKLYFEVDAELAAVYRKNSLDLEAFNGEGRNVLPVAATFVIDQAGVVRAMQADTDYTKRMEPAEALAQLGELAPSR